MINGKTSAKRLYIGLSSTFFMFSWAKLLFHIYGPKMKQPADTKRCKNAHYDVDTILLYICPLKIKFSHAKCLNYLFVHLFSYSCTKIKNEYDGLIGCYLAP